MTTRLLIGDVFDRMRELPDGSFDLIVTSPPFLALRSYLPDGHPDKAKEIGSEPTPAAYLDTLLALTAEWRRLLAPHGSIAVELGDTYAGSGGAGGDWSDSPATTKARINGGSQGGPPRRDIGAGWPLDKSLTGIPTLYAWSLAYGRNLLTGQESPAGRWRIRNLKPWIRSNPPVGALGDKERPATSYITVACVGSSRWFDLDAVRTAPAPANRRTAKGVDQVERTGKSADRGGNWASLPEQAESGGAPPLDWWHHVDAIIDAEIDARRAGKPNGSHTHRKRREPGQGGGWATLDDVTENVTQGARGVHIRRALERAGILATLDAYDVSPKGYAGAHYAVWPPELVRLMIDEMCPRRVCVTCGEPSRRIVGEAEYRKPDGRVHQFHADVEFGAMNERRASGESLPPNRRKVTGHDNGNMTAQRPTLGWSDCECGKDPCQYCGTEMQRNQNGDWCCEPCGRITDHWRPGRILDPFVGSGTTLAVASGMGRDSVGIDLDERNADLCAERVGMFLEVDYPDREVSA